MVDVGTLVVINKVGIGNHKFLGIVADVYSDPMEATQDERIIAGDIRNCSYVVLVRIYEKKRFRELTMNTLNEVLICVDVSGMSGYMQPYLYQFADCVEYKGHRYRITKVTNYIESELNPKKLNYHKRQNLGLKFHLSPIDITKKLKITTLFKETLEQNCELYEEA